jgi:hypothetical protein
MFAMSDQESDAESQSSNAAEKNGKKTASPIDNNVDSETLRVMVSTDNHLGYLERDPIRGNDSFAAFEEVLLLAKRHNVSELFYTSLLGSFLAMIQRIRLHASYCSTSLFTPIHVNPDFSCHPLLYFTITV